MEQKIQENCAYLIIPWPVHRDSTEWSLQLWAMFTNLTSFNISWWIFLWSCTYPNLFDVSIPGGIKLHQYHPKCLLNSKNISSLLKTVRPSWFELRPRIWATWYFSIVKVRPRCRLWLLWTTWIWLGSMKRQVAIYWL